MNINYIENKLKVSEKEINNYKMLKDNYYISFKIGYTDNNLKIVINFKEVKNNIKTLYTIKQGNKILKKRYIRR